MHVWWYLVQCPVGVWDGNGVWCQCGRRARHKCTWCVCSSHPSRKLGYEEKLKTVLLAVVWRDGKAVDPGVGRHV